MFFRKRLCFRVKDHTAGVARVPPSPRAVTFCCLSTFTLISQILPFPLPSPVLFSIYQKASTTGQKHQLACTAEPGSSPHLPTHPQIPSLSCSQLLPLILTSLKAVVPPLTDVFWEEREKCPFFSKRGFSSNLSW